MERDIKNFIRIICLAVILTAMNSCQTETEPSLENFSHADGSFSVTRLALADYPLVIAERTTLNFK